MTSRDGGTQTPAERALLVSVEIASRRKPISRSAQLARHAASLAPGNSFALEDPNIEDDSPASAPAATPDLDAEASLAEFRELVLSAGGEIVGEVVQRRAKADSATLLGSGKVEEVAEIAASTNATLILFDHDLTPTQLRNLEDALPCRVIDRTQLILDIFARHARTREGQL